MSGNKYCVIHGHFYQPPREDPWEDEIEKQPSAAPYHDWNERIYDECYRPNSFSRILNEKSEIIAVNNNYSYMNFNFGPTLFRWLAQKHPTVLKRVVEADKRSCEANHGHGSAIAQVYNHIIMPLASRKDKLTQIRWAKSFFKKHFHRETEGMWLAETAINMETIECLAEENIKFVILSPNQAESFRHQHGGDWVSTNNYEIDTKYTYRCFVEDKYRNRNGKYIDIFFFDESLSRRISFENMTNNADILANEINNCYDGNTGENQIVNIATDGETFGHHKKNADMCLAYFFKKRAAQSNINVVNYATFLAKNPPVREVLVKNAFGEGTAWSCAHGTGRWSRDCGCNTGALPGWNQKWREPFRRAMNTLQKEIDFVFNREMSVFFDNPAKIRDLYEPFIDDQNGIDNFLRKHTKTGVTISCEEIRRIIMLLEAQKFMLFAFTSCAWFFNDISGIEPAQNLKYALRAWQLTYPDKKMNSVLQEFELILQQAKSNLPDLDGKILLEEEALPMINHLERVAFTIAVNHYLYGIYSGSQKIALDDYSYKTDITRGEDDIVFDKKTWRIYYAQILHKISHESNSFVVALYKNGHQIEGIVINANQKLPNTEADFAEIMIRNDLLRFTLRDTILSFRDVITDRFVTDFADETYLDYLTWIGAQSNRLNAITDINDGLPSELAGTVKFYINKEWQTAIKEFLKSDCENNTEQLEEINNRAELYGILINKEKSAESIRLSINADLIELDDEFLNEKLVEKIICKLDVVENLSIPLHFHQVQDRFYLIYKQIVNNIYPHWLATGKPVGKPRNTIMLINKLAKKFGFNTDKTEV